MQILIVILRNLRPFQSSSCCCPKASGFGLNPTKSSWRQVIIKVKMLLVRAAPAQVCKCRHGRPLLLCLPGPKHGLFTVLFLLTALTWVWDKVHCWLLNKSEINFCICHFMIFEFFFFTFSFVSDVLLAGSVKFQFQFYGICHCQPKSLGIGILNALYETRCLKECFKCEGDRTWN